MKTAKVGDRVFDQADPRHVGIVRQVNLTKDGAVARIMWEETGWFSCRVPVADLQKAPEEPGLKGNETFQVKRAIAMEGEMSVPSHGREHSARITLNDNGGASAPEIMIIGRDGADIAWAILSYAKRHRIDPNRVGYSVVYNEGKKR